MLPLHCYRTGSDGRLEQQRLEVLPGKLFRIGAEDAPPTRLEFVRSTESLCRIFDHENHDWGTAYVYETGELDEIVVPSRFRWAVDESLGRVRERV